MSKTGKCLLVEGGDCGRGTLVPRLVKNVEYGIMPERQRGAPSARSLMMVARANALSERPNMLERASLQLA